MQLRDPLCSRDKLRADIGMRLSKRLQAIADFIERGSAVADIGTDHGFLPAYLAINGISEHIIASDISAGSLRAAERTVEKYGLEEYIKLVNAPGLDGIEESEVDTIVISGMGGETIVSILEDAIWVKNNKMLILQPQTKLNVLLNYIGKNKLTVKSANLIQDKGRDYLVMVVVSGQF